MTRVIQWCNSRQHESTILQVALFGCSGLVRRGLFFRDFAFDRSSGHGASRGVAPMLCRHHRPVTSPAQLQALTDALRRAGDTRARQICNSQQVAAVLRSCGGQICRKLVTSKPVRVTVTLPQPAPAKSRATGNSKSNNHYKPRPFVSAQRSIRLPVQAAVLENANRGMQTLHTT